VIKEGQLKYVSSGPKRVMGLRNCCQPCEVELLPHILCIVVFVSYRIKCRGRGMKTYRMKFWTPGRDAILHIITCISFRIMSNRGILWGRTKNEVVWMRRNKNANRNPSFFENLRN
jgi:hypothetical protein